MPKLIINLRDTALVTQTNDFDGIFFEDARRIHFPTLGARSAAYSRIHRLVQEGYLNAHQLPALHGRGSGRMFLTVGPKGRQLLAEHLGIPTSDLQRARELTAPILGAHHGAINAFRVSLELAAAAHHIDLQWVGERALRQQPTLWIDDPHTNKRVALIHDGIFRLTLGSGRALDYALEADRGTIPVRRMRSKLRAALIHGKGDPRTILYVVPDRIRAHHLANWTRDEAERLGVDAGVICIGVADEIDEHTILTPIWQVVGVAERLALVPQDVRS